MSYRCSCCNKIHQDLPDIAAARPDQWFDVPPQERARRVKLTSETCSIDGASFFIRGVLEVTILDYPRKFGFGVWLSQKREHFLTYQARPNSTKIGPFFGWLCTNIRYFQPDTFMLKAMAHFRGAKLRPYIELEPTDHPLAIAQKEGITLDEISKIVHYYAPRPK